MSTRERARIRNEVKHECELPEEENILARYISNGYCVEFRRRLRNLFLLDEISPRCHIYLKSAFLMKREKKRHLRFYYYMIHPFSIFRHYVRTWFFVDLVASINISSLNVFIKLDKPIFKYYIFVNSLRAATATMYMDRLCEYKQSSIYRFKILKLFLISFLVILWTTAFVYMFVIEKQEVWQVDYVEFRYFFVVCYSNVISMLIRSGYVTPSKNSSIVLIEIICLIFGYIIHLLIISKVLQLVTKYSSSGKKYYKLTQQVEEYIRYKQLPHSIRIRILKYFDFRFQQNYYKESEILDMLSPQLRQELLIHTNVHLLQAVRIFENLPLSTMCKIMNYMRPEIYLPSDVIITAGTTGDSMYFLLSGTVAVYTAAGKEVCHLSDGSNFGDVGLIIEGEHRIGTVVAIDCCEVLILHRKDFLRQLEPFPEMHSRIRRLAQDRVRRTITSGLETEIMSETSDRLSLKSKPSRKSSVVV